MSDINTIKNNYNNKLTNSHTSLKKEIKEELASSGGSEWKLLLEIKANSEIVLPESCKEIFVVMYDTVDSYHFTGLFNKEAIEKQANNTTQPEFYLYLNSSKMLTFLTYKKSTKKIMPTKFADNAISSTSQTIKTLVYYR